MWVGGQESQKSVQVVVEWPPTIIGKSNNHSVFLDHEANSKDWLVTYHKLVEGITSVVLSTIFE